MKIYALMVHWDDIEMITLDPSKLFDYELDQGDGISVWENEQMIIEFNDMDEFKKYISSVT